MLANCYNSIVLTNLFLLLLFADRAPTFLEHIPEDFFRTHEELAARKCNWQKHFTRKRVERALKLLHGVPCPSSSESSDQRANFFVEMQGAKLTLREKKAAEKKAAEEKKALEAVFGPQTLPEVTDEPEGLEVNPPITATLPRATEAVPTGDIVDQIPVVENATAVIALPVDGHVGKRKTPLRRSLREQEKKIEERSR